MDVKSLLSKETSPKLNLKSSRSKQDNCITFLQSKNPSQSQKSFKPFLQKHQENQTLCVSSKAC